MYFAPIEEAESCTHSIIVKLTNDMPVQKYCFTQSGNKPGSPKQQTRLCQSFPRRQVAGQGLEVTITETVLSRASRCASIGRWTFLPFRASPQTFLRLPSLLKAYDRSFSAPSSE